MTTRLRTDGVASTVNDMTKQEQQQALALLLNKATAQEIVDAVFNEKLEREARWIGMRLKQQTNPDVTPASV